MNDVSHPSTLFPPTQSQTSIVDSYSYHIEIMADGNNRQGHKREAEPEIDHEKSAPPSKTTKLDANIVEVVPPLNKANLGGTALEYFTDPYFYSNKGIRDVFMAISNTNFKNENPFLGRTLAEFFEEAWRQEELLSKDPESFLRDNFPLCIYTAILKTFKKWKEENNKGTKPDWVMNFDRIVDVDFQIEESKLSHSHDLECFSKCMDEVFEWHTNPKGLFVAPYFCFVQSSGMGKTKSCTSTRKRHSSAI